MSREGFDVPDLSVDAEGNPVFAPPAGAGGGAGGGAGPAGFDQEALAAASEVCGERPGGLIGAGGGFADNTEFQDVSLEFALVMLGFASGR